MRCSQKHTSRMMHSLIGDSLLFLLVDKWICNYYLSILWCLFRWSGSLKNAYLQSPRPFTNSRVGEFEFLVGRGVWRVGEFVVSPNSIYIVLNFNIGFWLWVGGVDYWALSKPKHLASLENSKKFKRDKGGLYFFQTDSRRVYYSKYIIVLVT